MYFHKETVKHIRRRKNHATGATPQTISAGNCSPEIGFEYAAINHDFLFIIRYKDNS